LVRHLQREREAEGAPPETHQLRLESDENLVRILTVHRAKGLEFEFVFCPFLWDGAGEVDKSLVQFHDAAGLAAIDLGSPQHEIHLARAKLEKRAEAVRLAYVALTRAKRRCIFFWGAINEADSSALTWLLHGEADFKSLKDADLRTALSRLEAESDGALSVRDCPLPVAPVSLRIAPEAARGLLAHRFNRALPPCWRVSSFSSLIAAQEREASDYDALDLTGAPLVDAPAAEDSLFTMPGGVRTGMLIHQLFEHIDFRAARGPEIAKLVRKKSAEFDFDPRWIPTLEKMIAEVVATPLNEAGDLRLDRIAPEQRIIEMEFLFPVGEAASGALREALAPLRAHGSRLPDAIGNTIIAPAQGFIRGFIDLVFEADGRYYLADYKSNHLGMRIEDYVPAALADAMHASWYDLQYLLYTLAVHRHLRVHLADYDYERHFGGVYYLFVRGMSPERGNRHGVYFTRPPLAVIEALDKSFAPTQRWAA
ncbi:MAG TPA: 3'-5' exonuclease, partial [Burkholderiales bacterium]|nr:3'-5' exonuclease [Burkholderiales bacterium]